ncbi:group II intron reverse transcriptase/maturase [Ruminiclostridium cellulolyticum]|uniref:RNA-directed DNA polymerase (Reverse transcriptase) n=1 Tax=Ruminiclostridium cellulolyticum (strain ATCC 35319 / DSM 5812 / JCM 6584 / H10) TaxID=394503 RepID=B8I7I5_RUMCH|nr:group II intron reverse transcriptase/maturase [Ruminiclostridium cellulolyticum]ACL77056.1 RNA-directed DNA polymerase (Reverse transcriptase) [Ruminiclostridium cellulolyticum H10]
MTKQKKLRHLEYYDLQEYFDNLYAQSKQGKSFTNLMKVISSEENIRLAYRNIKSNSGSHTSGTDTLNIKDIEKLSVEKLVEMMQRKLAWYQPKPVKRVEIPKPNGKTRPLGIPTIVDRLVQQCILQVLEPICEAKFYERSNGFRPNRSAEHAMAQCYRMVQKQNLYFVVDVDIKGFFDNVNHSKLIRQMWAMGIRDKQLICIIKQMLKAPVVMPDGETLYPTKGTPQGGILSPLLANIVLNELDWWISSQWEDMLTHREYYVSVNNNGSLNKSGVFRTLRRSALKEMYIVRYADDFKIFCRKRSDANKIFVAVKKWLKDRLKLEISEEKSKVVNLKKHYSEFLGFQFKTVRKGRKFVVRSHMSEKAIKRETEKLKEQIKEIAHCKIKDEEILQIKRYNAMVIGIHNYYRYATNISIDCMKIQRLIYRVMFHQLKGQLKRNGSIQRTVINKNYGKSRMLRFIHQEPICPIGYVQTQNPMYKKRQVCKYTVEGREEIHKNLKFDESVMAVLHMLAVAYIPSRSIAYMDNRVSLYAAQYGKCAVMGNVLWINEIHCHHKITLSQGGTDEYKNLVIIHIDVHRLIHSVKPDTIQVYLNKLKPNQSQLDKINKFRSLAGNPAI